MIKDKFDKIEIDTIKLKYEARKFLQSANLSSKSKEAYAFALKSFLMYHANTPYFSFQPEDIYSYIEYLYNKGTKNSTITVYASALRSFFSFLQSKALITKNPALRLSISPEKQKTDIKYIKHSDFKFLLFPKSLELIDIRNNLIMSILLYTGINKTDLASLKISNFRSIKRKKFFLLDNKEEIVINIDLYRSIKHYIDVYHSNPKAASPLFYSMGKNHSDKFLSDRMMNEIINSHLFELEKNSSVYNKLSPKVIKNTAILYQLSIKKKPDYILRLFKINSKILERYINLLEGFLE